MLENDLKCLTLFSTQIADVDFLSDKEHSLLRSYSFSNIAVMQVGICLAFFLRLESFVFFLSNFFCAFFTPLCLLRTAVERSVLMRFSGEAKLTFYRSRLITT